MGVGDTWIIGDREGIIDNDGAFSIGSLYVAVEFIIVYSYLDNS